MGVSVNREERRAGGKQRYIISNLVYGNLYPQLWLENQLKSLCDPTNLPALSEKYDCEYVLFSDEVTFQQISRHPHFMKLGQLCKIDVVQIQWPADSDQFASRYGLLQQMLNQVIPVALERNAWLSCIVADLVFAKHSLPKMLNKLEVGFDAVFNVPIRSAADSVNPLLAKLPGAPTDIELFNMAYNNLHSLWTHSTWNNPYYSRMPYSMLWKSEAGLVAHNFGVTPIVFKPNEEMRNVKGGIDSDLPGMCKKPFWASDWTDAAVAGVEPLSNGHYPPFTPSGANVKTVCEWAARGNEGKPCIYHDQINYLVEPLFYPDRKTFNNEALAKSAQAIAEEIQTSLLDDKLYEHERV